MRRRIALSAIVGLVLVPLVSAVPASAGGGSLVISAGVIGSGRQAPALWDGSMWTSPGPWNDPELCVVSWPTTDDETSVLEFRTAIEFPLTGLPADAIVTGAELQLRDEFGASGGPVEVRGYAGGGGITPADFTVSGTPIVINPTTTAAETYDVTSLVQPDMQTAGVAGFSLWPSIDRTSQANPQILHFFDCPGDPAPPVLTIQYNLPAASVAASLNDAAMTSPSPAQPLAIVGFALLLVATLGGLALASVRSRR